MDMLLIRKFLNKQCSDEELQQVYIWLNDPENAEEATAILKNSWQQVSDRKPDAAVDLEKLRNQIQNRLHLHKADSADHDLDVKIASEENDDFKNMLPAGPRRRRSFNWLRVAAIIIILEVVAFIVYKYLGTSQEEAVYYTEKTTNDGQKYTLYLNDGSKVILNANSTLRYGVDFGASTRDLILEGEAFFEVAEDETRPFRVETNGIITRALGTSFNIKAEKGESRLRVSLVTGSVEVKGGNQGNKTFVLVPGEEIMFDKQTEKFSKSSFNMKERVSWKDGVIYFHEKNLFEALEVLEKWYGVDIQVLNPKKAAKDYGNINGEFKNESLTNVLKVMSFAKGFSYNVTGKKVVIEL